MSANTKPILHHAPNTRSSTALWMLEELGVPYELRVLNFKKAEQREAAHLARNPMGKVPVLEHNGGIVTEGGAVCAYLADAFPTAGLAPAIGDPARGPYLRWMFFAGSSFEPAIIDKALNRTGGEKSMLPYGDIETTVNVAAAAVANGPWLLGDRFSAADVFFGAGIRWTTLFGILPKRPEFTAYIARLEARPALQRANAKDAELAATQG